MQELHREFADLLTQGIRSIAACEKTSIGMIEHKLGEEINCSHWTIQKWRQGNIPSAPKDVATLARACVARGHMDIFWLRRFLNQSHFPEKEALIHELFPEKNHTIPPLRRNIPGRSYEHFIGRKKELAELQRFLSSHHRIGVICLSGPAGVGKTALAVETAHHYVQDYPLLSPDERFDAIVWVTAKQTELLATGIARRYPTLQDLDSLHRAIAEVLDLPAITRKTAPEDRDIIVTQALTDHRTLIVLDNLEDIDDSSLMIFLRDLPAPSKAIVTTRRRIDVAVSLSLTAFNEIEARQLVSVTSQRYHLTLSDEQVEKLVQRTGRLALAIVRTLGRLAWRGSSVEAELKQMNEPSNIFYEFCFRKSIDAIRGSNAYKLFMALSLFSTDATRDALGYVAGLQQSFLGQDSERDIRDDGLSDLEVLSLITKKENRFGLEPLTKVQAQIELAAAMQQSFNQEAQIRLIAWYKFFVKGVEQKGGDDDYQAEIDNLINIVDWLMDQGKMTDVGWFFQRIRKILFADGYWELLVPLAEKVAHWAEQMDDVETLAGALESLSRIFSDQGDFARAQTYLEDIQRLTARVKSELIQAEIWVNRACVQYHQEIPLEEALSMESHLTWAIEVFRRLSKMDGIVHALNTLGNLYLKQRRLQEAEASYQEGLRMLEKDGQSLPSVRHWCAALRANLCQIALLRGQYEQVREELYDIIDDVTEQTDYAEVSTRLALCEYHLKNTEQAHHLRRQSEQIMERLKLIRPVCIEDEEWMRLERLGLV